MDNKKFKENFNFLNNEELEVIKNFNYLIIGLNEIGYILAKNLTILNVDKITLIDDTIQIIDDGKKNKKKSEIIRKKLNKSAEDTEIGTGKFKDIELYIQNNNLIIINEIFPLDLIKKWNDIAFESKNKMIWNLNIYWKGWIITDLNFIRVKYPFTKKIFNKITNITNEEMGRLTLEDNHNLENNDFISISEVEGMENINGNECRPIKVLNKKEILIENTKNFEKYKKSGKITKINVPHNLYYIRIINLIENNLLNNTYLIIKYGQVTINLLFLFFLIIKDNVFVEKWKKIEFNENELQENLKNIIKMQEKKINHMENLDMLIDILFTIFKNKPEKDIVFNSIIGNLSFHEIIKSGGKFKPIPGFLIIDFLKYFPNINMNLEKHIKNYFENNSFKIMFIGYNKSIIKLIKMLKKMKSLDSKSLEIFIFDINNKDKVNEIKIDCNIQIHFINNPFKNENKILDYNLIFCMIYDPNIISNYFYKCKKYNKILFTPINFNFEIKLIYTEEEYNKYGFLKNTLINPKNIILLNNKENNLSLNLVNYSNQIYKIIFEEPLFNFKDYPKDDDIFENIAKFDKNSLHIFLLYIKLNIIDLISKKNNFSIDDLLDISFILIYKLIRLNFEEKTTINFIQKNNSLISKFMKKFCMIVLKIMGLENSDKIFEDLINGLENYVTLYNNKVKYFFPLEIKLKFEKLFNESNKIIKNNLFYRISIIDRIENNYESYIIDFINIMSLILSEIYPTQVQIQKKDIALNLGLFKNDWRSCNIFQNILIAIVIVKKALNKENSKLSLDFEINEYNF